MKYKVGDKVRRINYDNCWSDGTRLKVGEIVTVVKINHKEDISVNVNGKVKGGNDPSNFELVEEPTPTPTPVVNVDVTVNLYENACWYCRKGGLVDLYLAGAMGICPSCGRVCNNVVPTPKKESIVIEFKSSKPKENKPLTTEELKALPNGTRVFTVWFDFPSTREDWTTGYTCWRTKRGNDLNRDNGSCSIGSNGKHYNAYLEEPERPF